MHSDPNISFVAVPRDGVLGQPNDEAMRSTVKTLSQESRTTCIAVASVDSTLVEEILTHILQCGKRAIVVGPEISSYDSIAQRFANMGAKVVRCKLLREVPCKVEATLHVDGSGDARLLTESRQMLSSGWLQRQRTLMNFLRSKNCPVTEQTLHTVAVKYWYQQPVHSQASLVVFPPDTTFTTLCDMIAQGGSFPQHWQRELAYCLPVTGLGGITKSVVDRYGSRHQRQILFGEGPFMLERSEKPGLQPCC